MRISIFAFVLAVGAGCWSADAATFVVTNTAATGPGSLDNALAAANTSTPPSLITFNIPGGGTKIIIPDGSLNDLVRPATIDATTQPGYSNGYPAVWISSTGGVAYGLNITTSNSLVRGLRIAGFPLHGISLLGSSNRVEACHIFSNQYGVIVNDGQQNVIGGTASSNANVISGNLQAGVSVFGPTTSNNVILGNFIGVHPTNPAVPMPNLNSGVSIDQSPGNVIAGTGAIRQIISGNVGSGIIISSTESVSNRIVGNHLGIDLNGFTAVPNTLYGINVSGAPFTQIGGTNVGDRNVISGNGNYGIYMAGTNTQGTVIEGNYIGVSSFGAPAISNRYAGISMFQVVETRIGGTGVSQGNVISGNGGPGISVGNACKSGLIQGNTIGLSGSGSVISNAGVGIYFSGASDWTVGGTNAGARNQICGNVGVGIDLNASDNIVIQGNLIGVDSSGFPKPNAHGIEISSGSNLLIGGSAPGARNYLSGNAGHGVSILNVTALRIQGNHVGLGPSGGAASNGTYGIYVLGGTDITIGGTNFNEGNVISGSSAAGIELSANSSGVVVRANRIGTDATGAVPGPWSSGIGIRLAGRNHWIGGTEAGQGNVIGNHAYGVMLSGVSNRVAGNLIGLATNGLATMTNSLDGMLISTASNCVIGGLTAAERNVIAGGTRCIELGDIRAVSNVIVGNYIGFLANGTNYVPANSSDLAFTAGGQYTQVGGATPAERNVIGAMMLTTTNARHNVIAGNYIGTDALARGLTNVSSGIYLNFGAVSNRFGGTADGEGNVIFGTLYGVRCQNTGVDGNRFEGNFLGVTTNGSRLGVSDATSSAGFIFVMGQDNIVGGTNPAAGNTIAYFATGIGTMNSNRNAFLGNRIYSNAYLSIDLYNDHAMTTNDTLDADLGPNEGQNWPTVTNAQSFFGSTLAYGILASKASTTYRIELFGSEPTFSSQPRRFLGATTCTTTAGGTGTFTAVLGGYVVTGWTVRATATDPNGNTSEFGGFITVTPATDTDNDRMPNFWETQYGLNPSVSNGPVADADGDGIPDYAEYLADTKPNDATSYFEFLAIGPTGTATAVTFPTSANRVYDLEQTTQLAAGGPWTSLATNLPGTGNLRNFLDGSAVTNPAYRIRARIP